MRVGEGGKPGKEPGRHNRVVGGAVWGETIRKPLGELEIRYQRAELVTARLRQQAARKLEGVKDFRTFPLAKFVLKYTYIYVRIVGNKTVTY